MILVVFEGYDSNSRASLSNTTYIFHLKILSHDPDFVELYIVHQCCYCCLVVRENVSLKKGLNVDLGSIVSSNNVSSLHAVSTCVRVLVFELVFEFSMRIRVYI